MQRLFLLILIFPTLVLAGTQESFLLDNSPSGSQTAIQELSRTVIDLQISNLDYQTIDINGQREYIISLPEEFDISRGSFLGPDNAVLPTITRIIAVPFDSDPQLKILQSDFTELKDIKLAEADREDLQSLDPLNQGQSGYYQPQLAKGEIAGEMRDLRLYAITLCPVQYDPQTFSLKICTRIEVEISHPGTQITRDQSLSEAFAPLYRGIVDNPAVFSPFGLTRGAYWIIYPDAFAANIQPLVDWKTAKGFSVAQLPKSIVGTSYTAIRTYILTRFDSCTVKPDYIVIVGDVTMPNNYGIPTKPFSNGYGDGDSDNYYTFLRGGDYFPEVLIGRISIDNASELANYLDKLFQYERTPYMTDTGWYHRATMVCGSDGYSFVSPRLTKMWCREVMMDSGYTQVDTFFASWSDPVPLEDISASIDNGVSFVNYRGYGYANSWTPPDWSSYHIDALTNGPMYPIMTSIVCATGDFNDSEDNCFGEHWIRDNQKGGAGFIGNTNHYAHTKWTNAIDVGIYWGWFVTGSATLAQGQLMGKTHLYNAFPNNRETGGQVELYTNTYNDLGDPELNIWIDIPRAMTASFDDSISVGESQINVHVANDIGGPLANAAVCIWKGSEVFETGFTGADGNILLVSNAQTPGDMRLTVVAKDFIPIEDTIDYYTASVIVGYLSHILDDDANGESVGDGNGQANPSELLEIPVTVQNFGADGTALGVHAALSSEFEFARIERSGADFGDIAPGATVVSSQPYLVRIAANAPDQQTISLPLQISDEGGRDWQSAVRLTISAASIRYDSLQVINGGNGRIDPGETVDLVIFAENAGSRAMVGANAILRCVESDVTITDSTSYFGDCQPRGSFNNSNDRFTISVSPDARNGQMLNFEIVFTGSGPQESADGFGRMVGTIATTDPVGPDSYGYYCYDNTDTGYADCPTDTFIAINTSWSYVTLTDDDAATIPLPFPVQYYGQTFDSLTICDNGFVAMGSTWFTNFFNSPIPGPQNARAMVAPFWDDFQTSSLRVYYHHDTTTARFIIGWRNALDGDNGQNQTFEIVFLDEEIYPTITGDNEIEFAYWLVNSPSTNSVGICSPDRRDGIGYLFDDLYAPGAAALAQRRVLKFTTGHQPPCQYILGDVNNNGIFNGIDVIYSVSFFRGGNLPSTSCDCPPYGVIFPAGDVNGNCAFNGIDVTYMVGYFKGGAEPVPCPACPPNLMARVGDDTTPQLQIPLLKSSAPVMNSR